VPLQDDTFTLELHLQKGDHVKSVLEQVLAQEGLTNVIDCETIAEYIIKISS
jgi:hypothetical protein